MCCRARTHRCPCGAEGRRDFSKGAYSLGKVVWGKGWEQLLRLLAMHAAKHPDSVCHLDAFGEGEALTSVRRHHAAARGSSALALVYAQACWPGTWQSTLTLSPACGEEALALVRSKPEGAAGRA